MIPIAKPLMGDAEKKAIIAVLDSGVLAQGVVVEQFEKDFAAAIGARHAIAVSSGTTALHLALLAHGVGPGDEVITSPHTFIATGNAVLHVGARPVFVDIDGETYNIDPSLIEEKITARTKAIIPVHLYGYPADMSGIMDIAERRGLAIIEDACQAHGASIHGKCVGTFSTGCFSFYPTKNITTGEGGIVTTDDDALAERLRLLRNHGQRQRYYHDILGYNFRMSDVHAAIGLAQLSRFEEFTQKRIANAAFFDSRLSNVITPKVAPGFKHVYHQYTIRVKGNRDAALAQLHANGIGAGIYYPVPLHKQKIYLDLGYRDDLPQAEKAAAETISLPVHPALTDEELEKIAREVGRV